MKHLDGAFDPEVSVWVSASAGSGKTWLLVHRVLRLLLEGVRPAKILCITYTKAAEAEMRGRLNAMLEEWMVIGEEELKQRLMVIQARTTPEYIKRARSLYLELLDCPSGIRIYTIHGLCQQILSTFPLEAGIAPSFSIVDGKTSQELLEQAKAAVFETAAKDGELKNSLAELAIATSDYGLDVLIREFLGEKNFFRGVLEREGNLQNLPTSLAAFLNIDPAVTEAEVTGKITDYIAANYKKILRAAEIIAGADSPSTANEEKEKAANVLRWFEDGANLSNLEPLRDAFLTKTNSPRAKIPSKGVTTAKPQLATFVIEVKNTLAELYTELACVRLLAANQALFKVLEGILRSYQNLKESNGFLDYDDLIAYAHKLVRDESAGSWVLFKLDGGIDHLLLDEAQDTSSMQWELTEALTQEFFAGIGAAGTRRSIFVVGDDKQSIYSFQGAEPEEFKARAAYFANQAEAALKTFKTISLDNSYRTTHTILRLVDTVLEVLNAKSISGGKIIHTPIRRGDGEFILWPLLAREKVEDTPWSLPIPAARMQSAESELALKIAEFIKERLNTLNVPSRSRPARPEDFMILLQRRSSLFLEVFRALRRMNIPVTGLDRLELTKSLPILDLLAFARFLLLPEDDYNLACLLKSPICNLSENDLFNASYNRGDNSIWQRISQDDSSNAVKKTAAFLKEYLDTKLGLSPYALYYELLEGRGMRMQFLDRLGDGVHDVLDEFLNQAYEYEKNHTPSLQGFVSWFTSSTLEIKRDMEKESGKVRIMTVHASKGLQAPFVILPDTAYSPKLRDKILFSGGTDEFCFWNAYPKVALPEVEEIKDATRQSQYAEYYRLLYVALTRAEDFLMACGIAENKNRNDKCWHAILETALPQIPSSIRAA